MTRPLRLARVLALAGAAAAMCAAPADARTSIGARPALFPTFHANVSDYVSRCHRGVPLRLAVRAPAGTRIRVDAARPRRGAFRGTLHRGAGQAVTVRIGARRVYHLRCLPGKFPAWSAERHGTPQAKWYLVTPSAGPMGSPYVALFDRNGVPVWWMRTPGMPLDAKLLPGGHLAWSEFTGGGYASRSVPYEEHRLDGSLVRTIAAAGGVETDFHEMQPLPNGHYLVVSYVPRDHVDLSPIGGPADVRVRDAEVQEVTRSGDLVWSWNSKDHVDVAESAPFKTAVLGPAKGPDGTDVYDLVHLNSAEPDGKSVIVSLRHTDAVYKIDKATGAIQWKLGGTHTPRSLKVTGQPDDSLVFGGQHDARVLPDGTLTVHDNRSGSDLKPRAVRFRIDEAAGTATQLEELTDPQAVLSQCCGSARKLPGGDWVMSWGFGGLVTELKPSGQRVFGITFAGLFSYRAVPILPGQLSARRLRAAMDRMHPR